MPLRSLRSASAQPHRKRCRMCHNLDPRNHPSSKYDTESSRGARAHLSLVIDAFALSKTKDVKDGGCRYCSLLSQALDAFFGDWRGSRRRINVELKEKESVKLELDCDHWKAEQVEIYCTKTSRGWPTLGSAHRIPPNSGSDDTFNFARRCIQDCLTNAKHGACKLPSKSSSSMPKRLLDVGRVTAPIRIIDTQGKVFEYVALSHCWGAESTLTSTKSNWKKLSSNIPFSALSPLFQDAIIITRQLGLRYIWIDSLCIIQDSARDWETESSKMGIIYENSYVTISATTASNGNDHCLRDRRKPVKLQMQDTTGKELEIRARKIINHHPTKMDGEPAKPMGRLTSRAWTLQEHVLSTRILHYTETELLFECKTSFRCECAPLRKPYPTTPALIPKAIAKKSKRSEAVWEAWHRIVEQYSTRDLTVSDDKLPAISGIAAKIQAATESMYIAGLWQDNLASDLLWSTSAVQAPDAQYFALDKYRAPTFSWASLNTAITYPCFDEEESQLLVPSIKLVSSSIKVAGLNPYGAVSEGSITVLGPTIHAILSSSQREDGWEYVLHIKGTSCITISHDCLLVEDTMESTSTSAVQTMRRAKCGDILSQCKVSVLCLGVARYDTCISGLVLGKAGGGVTCWSRLGTFSAGSEVFKYAKDEEVCIL